MSRIAKKLSIESHFRALCMSCHIGHVHWKWCLAHYCSCHFQKNKTKIPPRAPRAKLRLKKDVNIATLQIACNVNVPSVADNEIIFFCKCLKNKGLWGLRNWIPFQVRFGRLTVKIYRQAQVHSDALTVNHFAISPVRNRVNSRSEGRSSDHSTYR